MSRRSAWRSLRTQNIEWSKIIQGLDSSKLAQLQKKVEAGQACTVPDEKPLPPEAWSQVQLIAYVGAYAQRQQLKSLLSQSILVNIDQNKSCPSAPASSPVSPGAQNNLGLNVFVNKAIVCRSFLTDSQIQAADPVFRESAYARKAKQCAGLDFLASIPEKNFNVLNQLAMIKAPMLIVGAENDQLVSSLAKEQIWTALSESQKRRSQFVVLPQCGHNSFLECPNTLDHALTSFLHN